MIDIDVRADFRQVQRMLRNMPGVVEKAAARSLNRTNDSVGTLARRLIAKEMGIPVGQVKAGMIKFKAFRHRLIASTVGRGRPLNLIRFNARQTRKGVSAKAWGKRKVYRGTFVGNQGRTVFVRTSKERLPIKAVWGPGIPQTMLQDAIVKAMTEKASTEWRKNFARDVQFYLQRARA